MSTSLFGVRYLLSGAPDEWVERPVNPEEVDEKVVARAYGAGYAVDDGVVLRPGYAAARDMWVLDDVRIKQLARYGVRNEKSSCACTKKRGSRCWTPGSTSRRGSTRPTRPQPAAPGGWRHADTRTSSRRRTTPCTA